MILFQFKPQSRDPENDMQNVLLQSSHMVGSVGVSGLTLT